MTFTERELALIAKAGRKAKDARIIRVCLLLGMMSGLACMFAGVLDSEKLAYGVFIAVFLAIAYPQLGGGPKYEDLLALLRRKAEIDRESAGTTDGFGQDRTHHRETI